MAKVRYVPSQTLISLFALRAMTNHETARVHPDPFQRAIAQARAETYQIAKDAVVELLHEAEEEAGEP